MVCRFVWWGGSMISVYCSYELEQWRKFHPVGPISRTALRVLICYTHIFRASSISISYLLIKRQIGSWLYIPHSVTSYAIHIGDKVLFLFFHSSIHPWERFLYGRSFLTERFHTSLLLGMERSCDRDKVDGIIGMVYRFWLHWKGKEPRDDCDDGLPLEWLSARQVLVMKVIKGAG